MISNGVKRLKELLFRNRSTRQTITKNIFWLSISQVGSRLIRAIIIIYSARVLGAAEYGVFSYALSLAGFFTVFADLGINQILTRELVREPKKQQYFFSTAFWLKMAVLTLTAVLIIFAAPHFSKIEAAKILIPLVALITIFDGLRDFTLSSFRAAEKMEYEALLTIITNVAITVFGFAAIAVSATAKSLTLSYAFSVAIGFVAGLFILKENFLKIFSHFKKELVKPILTAAFPIVFTALLGVFMLNTDIIMIGWWRTPEEVGYYSAGQRILQILYTLPAILATSMFPILNRFVSRKEKEKEKSLMEKTMAMVYGVAAPIFVGGVILATSIIKFIYGKEYLPAVLSFQVLLLTPFLIYPLMLLGNLILAHNEQSKLKLPVFFGAVGNIALNVLLIPPFGIVGSAIATVIAQFLNVGLTWRAAKKISDFSTLKYLKKIFASAIIMGFFSMVFNFTGLNVMINIILSAGIYFYSLYLMKEETFKDILSLIPFLKKFAN